MVKKLQIVFENCDYAVIEGSNLCNIKVSKEKLLIEIKSEGNEKFYPFGCIELETSLFDKLEEKDIVYIELIEEDRKVKRAYFPWHKSSPSKLFSQNMLQHNELLPDGTIRITTDLGAADINEYVSA